MRIPHHIAIIMDGNGRWAKKRRLPRSIGHARGINRMKKIVRESKKLGVKTLTIFAFSTENWNRPAKEIKFLFLHLKNFLNNYKKELMKNDIKFIVIGRKDRIDKQVIKKIEMVEEATKDNKSFIFNVALDYGGRWDIINAAKSIINEHSSQKLSNKDINENTFSKYLSLGNIPDPDFLIRTGGEMRVSNFLIWNLAYSEFYFTPTFWPDFGRRKLHDAIEIYSKRDRRFGEIHE